MGRARGRGLLERELVGALLRVARSVDMPAPARDVAVAVSTAIAGGSTPDLGAAWIRAGLVAQLAGAIPMEAGCSGWDHLAAIDLGAAASRATRELGFSNRTEPAAPKCAETIAASRQLLEALVTTAPPPDCSADCLALASLTARWRSRGRLGAEDARSLVHTASKAILARTELPQAAIETLEAAAVAAVDDGTGQFDAERFVRALLPSSPWLVDVGLGVPKLASDDLALVGDGRVGYRTDDLGVEVHGAVSRFQRIDSIAVTFASRFEIGGAGTWWAGDRAGPVRLGAELRGAFVSDRATYVPRTVPSRAGYAHDEASSLGRGALGGRLRWRGEPTVEVDVELAGGLQGEVYRYVTLDPDDPSFLRDTRRLGGFVQHRGMVHWLVWPAVVSVRPRLDVELFQVTRDVLAVATAAAPTLTSETFTEVDVSGRFFALGDVAALAGFVPALWGGTDVFWQGGNAGGSAVVVPVIGLGIVHDELH